MAKVLVTGGFGFVGSYVVRECLKQGHEIRVLDNGFRGRSSHLQDISSKFTAVEGDMCDPKVANEACKGMDFIFHLAAINGTRHFYEIPHQVLNVNVKGLISVLEAAQNQKCKKFLFASSSELYNKPEQIPSPETVPIMLPDITNARFSYAGSKIIGELFCLNQDPAKKIPAVIIRYHNIYGPRMGYEHVIPEIFVKIKKATNDFEKKSCLIEIQGDGSETRAFCYVEDAARATVLAMDKGLDHEIYHIGTQRETAILDLIKQIGKTLGVELEIKPGKLMPGSTPRRCPDISKLRKLGYEPQYTLEQGLAPMLEWYKNDAKVAVKS